MTLHVDPTRPVPSPCARYLVQCEEGEILVMVEADLRFSAVVCSGFVGDPAERVFEALAAVHKAHYAAD